MVLPKRPTDLDDDGPEVKAKLLQFAVTIFTDLAIRRRFMTAMKANQRRLLFAPRCQ